MFNNQECFNEHQSNKCRKLSAFLSIGAMTPLEGNFVPGPMDVVCCRGRAVHKYRGNINFRSLVNKNIEKYSSTKSKINKSYIIMSIVDQIRQESPNGGFVKRNKDDGRWYEIGDHLAREKVSQCLRDSLSPIYRSSTTSKRCRRNEEVEKFDNAVDQFVQNNCKGIIDNMRGISKVSYHTDDANIQSLFNQANSQILHLFKENEERASKRRMTSFVQ